MKRINVRNMRLMAETRYRGPEQVLLSNASVFSCLALLDCSSPQLFGYFYSAQSMRPEDFYSKKSNE